MVPLRQDSLDQVKLAQKVWMRVQASVRAASEVA
jgi:hypothetical protein